MGSDKVTLTLERKDCEDLFLLYTAGPYPHDHPVKTRVLQAFKKALGRGRKSS